MTEKRYYYTDPLAAAWMAKHFDIQLEERGNPVFPAINWDDWFSLADLVEVEPSVRGVTDFYGKWYIHPDSLQLLEPRVGDGVTFYGTFAGIQEVVDTSGSIIVDVGPSLPIKEYKIIHRDGISFIWPEEEKGVKNDVC